MGELSCSNKPPSLFFEGASTIPSTDKVVKIALFYDPRLGWGWLGNIMTEEGPYSSLTSTPPTPRKVKFLKRHNFRPTAKWGVVTPSMERRKEADNFRTTKYISKYVMNGSIYLGS